jgi:multicomponent Na+:H+ antiporter subunit D
MNSIAPLPVAVPLAVAAILLMFGGYLPARVVRGSTVVAALAETVLAGVLAHAAQSGLIVYWFGGWTPRHGVAIGVSFAIDRIGAGAAALSGAIVTAGVVSARRSFGDRPVLTHALMLTMLAAMAGFCLTGDIFNLFVFYELMAVSAFGLAAYQSASVPSLRAALNFAITNSVGAFLLLIGIALLYGRTGALNLAQIGRQLHSGSHVDGLVVIAVTTIVVGFLVKAAIMPFHFWLVDVASSAPLPLVVILGGVLDALAVYAIARVYWTVFAPSLAGHAGALQALLLTLGAGTALLGGVLALSARGNRRVLAFVLVSHTGTLLVGVGCLSALGIAGAAIYAVADGAIKATLVLSIGMLEGDGNVAESGVVPVALLVVAGLALAGFPFFGVALAEAVIERAAATEAGPWIALILIVASVLTGAAILRVAVAAARSRGPRVRATGFSVAATTLALVTIGARFLLTRWVAIGAAAFVASAAYGKEVLDGAKAAPAAAVGGVRLPVSTELLQLGAVAGALAIVALLEWLRPRTRRSAEVYGATTIGNAIRRLHDGSLGDSVAWVTLGATTFAAVLAVALH